MKELIDSDLESKIITMVGSNPVRTTDLIANIQKVRPGTPKQSVYLALRKLTKKEIIVISGKKVSIHHLWASKMLDFFQNVLGGNQNNIGSVQLDDGEDVIYKFNSLLSLDMFWGHIITGLIKRMKPSKQAYLYNPHEWFLIARDLLERELLKESQKLNIPFLFIISGDTPVDRITKKHLENKGAKCHLVKKDLYQSNYYMNCFGDYIIEVWVHKSISKKIDDLYRELESIDDNFKSKLKNIIEEKGHTHKIRISRSLTKAGKIEKKFKKYFI